MNLEKYSIDFAEASNFDRETGVTETRYVSVGFIKNQLDVMVYLKVDDRYLRLINLLKANRREIRNYARETRQS